jgi:isopenicillin-N N-acyltransferase like protein
VTTLGSGTDRREGGRSASYPTVRITGEARARGRQYGTQAGARIAGSITGYERAFSHFAGWGWDRVRQEALRFVEPIEGLFPSSLEEMRGIAEGAQVRFEDILAINVRTEIMYAGEVRTAAGGGPFPPAECTAIGVLPETTADGHTLIAQNWDWLEHCFDTVVILESRPDEGPAFVSVVEAGLLAKTGMNADGLGVCTNALVTRNDVGAPGIPYHVMLRAFMDCLTPSDAIELVVRGGRSSSANYLIGHADGIVLQAEAEPGGPERLHLRFPQDGVLFHTNHFLTPEVGDRDLSIWSMPDSPVRLDRIQRFAAGRAGTFDPEMLAAALSDHGNFPSGVCSHADPRDAPEERGATIASLVMDLDARRLWIAEGSPCVSPYREHDLTDLFVPSAA